MAIIGVICSVVVLLYFLFAWGFWGLMVLPKYNIGGVENSWGTRILWLLAGVVLFAFWNLWLTNLPFSITIS